MFWHGDRWYGAGMALVIGIVFVRMPKDTREGWQMKDAVSDISSGEQKGISTA